MPVVSVYLSVVERITHILSIIVPDAGVDCHVGQGVPVLHAVVFDHRFPAPEVGWLVHVQPDTTELDFAVEDPQHLHPIFRCIGMEEIDKVDTSWPDLSHVVRTV